MPEAGPTWFESELGLSGSDLIFVEAGLIWCETGLNQVESEMVITPQADLSSRPNLFRSSPGLIAPASSLF